ncbi:uncharacterized protein FIBRA_02962 [Fibroporia radiculosa]|uniref:Uncharacterized protein n=1 Tax=Fibroporia radiculosa TaxID=599839 RepID=J4I9C4_9APHY|nr:uncharacterized protein FIBRA_02962 [Fibroporia radiculosa]CCM00916.1 predicted protein [Fibroporia radiculosa]
MFIQVPAHLRSILVSLAFLYHVVLCITFISLSPSLAAATGSDHAFPPNVITVISPSPNTNVEAGTTLDIALRAHHRSGEDSISLETLGMKIELSNGSVQVPILARSRSDHLAQEWDNNGVTIRYKWPIPSCLHSGEYHVTTHTSADHGLGVIPVTIQNDLPSHACKTYPGVDMDRSFHAQPPVKRATSLQPNTTQQTTLSATDAAEITVTAVSSELTVVPSGLPATIVIEPPSSETSALSPSRVSGFSTVYKTFTTTATVNGSEMPITVTATTTAPESITIVLTSLETIVSTTTASASTLEFTST